VNEKEVVLFVPSGLDAFNQQLATALYLASQSEFRPHFLLISEVDHQFVDQLRAVDIPFSTLDPIRKSGKASVSASSDINRGGPKSRIHNLVKGLRWWRQLWLRKRVTKRLVRPLAPRCSIVSQERQPLFLPILKALRELRVSIILMLAGFDSWPVASASPRRESYLLKAGLNKPSAPPENSLFPTGIAILNRQVQRWMPSQVYDSSWGNMLFYPAWQTLLLRIMGMLPRNPWYQGTTFPDHIMISGNDEAAIYAEAQVDPDKLLLYGSHPLDELYERWSHRAELRHKLIDDYHLERNQSILIVSLPRLWEQNLASEEVHWQSINEILDVLSRQKCNVVIALHPSSNRNLYDWIEERYPVKMCKEPLTDILVVADIFVAAYSSTIRWAVGLGIPVINLDLWSLNWDMYRNLTGCQTVTTISEFDELLKRLAETPNNDRLNCEPSAAGDTNAILIDGRAKARLLRFIQSLDGATAITAVASKHTEHVL